MERKRNKSRKRKPQQPRGDVPPQDPSPRWLASIGTLRFAQVVRGLSQKENDFEEAPLRSPQLCSMLPRCCCSSMATKSADNLFPRIQRDPTVVHGLRDVEDETMTFRSETNIVGQYSSERIEVLVSRSLLVTPNKSRKPLWM